MKTSNIIAHLESINKKELIVRILTESKSEYKSDHRIKSISGTVFFIEVDLQFVDFGTNEFAIKSKAIKLIFFKNEEHQTQELKEKQKLIVEDFFRNYFIPDLYYVKPENKNHRLIHHFAN